MIVYTIADCIATAISVNISMLLSKVVTDEGLITQAKETIRAMLKVP